ncbi:hypothetical protein LJB86_04465 [Deltaproteobacteria bacterium OttesenSCG-928-M10]|nr:hypothetical protein [Deltaproteobacteria bacterium OttesenSCG-928-M10]
MKIKIELFEVKMGDSTSTKSKKAWQQQFLMWVIIIFIVFIIYTAADNYNTYRYGYPKVMNAGPLETSFCPAIPQGIFLGMPVQQVTFIMGPGLDTAKEPQKGLRFYQYITDEFPIFGTAGIGFIFINDRLYAFGTSVGSYLYSQENKYDFEKKIADYKLYLIDLYGKPKIMYQKIPGASANISEILLWEFANNAVLLFPLTVDSEHFASLVTVVSPLSNSGHYDLSFFH